MDLSSPEDLQPPCHSASTPVTHLSRKRKHDDTLDFPTSPKFSSTLNESLIGDLKDICIVGSGPNTPEKRTLIAQTYSSPIQESRKILYGSIKIVKPDKKFAPVRTKSAPVNSRNLLHRILNINVVMDVVFKYLSDGDLYRVSSVSQSFYQALRNSDAFARYKVYKNNFKASKENYVITPPASPDKCDSPPRTSSENFNKFVRAARCLNRTQSLTKCRKCEDVAVVDNEITQCQNISCGLIYCLRCSSCSETGAKDFKDACGHAVLRPRLANRSNIEDSYFNFSSHDSGFYSGNESTPRVRRNLFTRSHEKPKVLSVNNKSKNRSMWTAKREISYVPVVPQEQSSKNVDCDSPPRFYAVGSKQSKKNLKRLTR